MAPNIFISYSRREVGFVDELSSRLEKKGFDLWLDYHRLVPGTPWSGQIDKGLREAGIILLVVSKESIASPYVELEWRQGLKDGKRVILAIFEAVTLPPELANLEWVDFRGGFRSALNKLTNHLNAPLPIKRPAPQRGFKAPLVVLLTAGLSAIIGVYSLLAFWTILLPIILVPLAWRVLKRSYNIQQVQTALWMLSIGVFFAFTLLVEFSLVNVDKIDRLGAMLIISQAVSIPFCSVLLIIFLRSAPLQRWGKPETNLPRFANKYKPNNPKPKPVTFFIDHAPQDKLSAADISKGLTKYGHSPAADFKSAEAVFVLISRFKTDTEADPEKQAVFPVLIQTAQPSEKLSRVQWIDYRKGIRSLDALAQLLPDPVKMLSALGVRPTNGAQTVTPNVIGAMVNFLTLLVMIGLASLLSYMVELYIINSLTGLLSENSAMVTSVLTLGTISLALISVLTFFIVRALNQRRGWPASIFAFLMAEFLLFVCYVLPIPKAVSIIEMIQANGNDTMGIFLALPIYIYMIGLFFINLYALFNLRDIRRWFPAKAK